MKKKPLIILGSLFLCGIVLFTAYYFLYFKKVAIYDHICIEFSGLSDNDIAPIKTVGVTPLGKKIIINHKDTNYTKVPPGHYQSIEFIIPDTLASKISSVDATINEKKYTFKISDLMSTASSDIAHTYTLPPEVKSHGTIYNKLSSAFPFNVILPVLKKALRVLQHLAQSALLMIGFVLIVLCIIYLYKLISEISQKSSIKKIITVLQEKKIRYIFLFITLIILILWPFLWLGHKFMYFLIVLLYCSFVLQNIGPLFNKSYVLYIFRSFIMITFCFEIVCGVLNSKKNKINRVIGNITMGSNIVGWRSKPNTFEEKSFATFGDDTVYNIRVSTDEFGRRISGEGLNTKQIRQNTAKKKHALFLGCSFTLGSSLNYRSTFPFIFENKYPEYKSYNYGVGGWGPHQSSLLFDEGLNTINNLSVPKDSGFCLYTFIDHHLDRVYGNIEFSLSPSPDVYVNDHKLVSKKRSIVKYYFAKFLSRSETIQYFNIDISYPKTVNFYKRFAGIINYTANKYWDMKPHGEFFVGLFPGWVKDTSWLTYLDQKIKVLYIPCPQDYYTNNDFYLIPGDFHPTKELNSYYVKEISKSMIKNKYGVHKSSYAHQ